jgi:hypothetical protein|tara:strand:- start:2402 stop:3661 length:1260 start_codon:yes stop_codon:yes gene_type:complete
MSDFITIGNTGSFLGNESVEVFPIEDGTYDVRVRVINSLGVRGPWQYYNENFLEAKGAPPADVTNFSGNVVGENIYLSWTPVPDLDLAHYLVRFSPATSGATYDSSEFRVKVSAKSSTVTLPTTGTGTYFIKAVDEAQSGSNQSVNPSLFITTTAALEDLNVVANISEHTAFTGTLVDTLKLNDTILLDFFPPFDTPTENWNDRLGDFDAFTGFALEGFYYFTNSIDLGAKFTSRLSYVQKIGRTLGNQEFDSQTGLFDAANPNAPFDGSAVNSDDVLVELQVRQTDDDPQNNPSWSGWSTFTVADFTGRAYEFRAKLSTIDSNASPILEEVTVNVDMPDRTFAEADITFTGSKVITFANSFVESPAVGIGLQNMTDGDRYTITNKTRTGFTINIFTGSAVSTNAVTLDYVAKGYGKGR